MEDAIPTPARRRSEAGPAVDRLAEARALRDAGRPDKAEALAQKALRRDPDDGDALHLLGLIAQDRGRLPRAVQLLEKAARSAPDSPAVLCDLGLAYKAAGRLDESIACQRRVAERLPDSPLALSNLGAALIAAGAAAEAVAPLARASALAPAHAEIAYNLGSALLAAGRAADAESAFRRALALDPTHVRARTNLGVALKEQRRVEESIAALRDAVAAAPGYADAEWNLALALMLDGRWAEGLSHYESRRRLAGFAIRRVDAAPWNGEPLRGRSLLVHAEQGLGDAIQFCRWLSRLGTLDGPVTLLPPPALRPLFRSLDVPVAVADGSDVPPTDLELPLMSLPHLVGPAEPFWPDAGPYLAPEPARLARWRNELGGSHGLTIAIAWQGNRDYRADRRRSIPLDAFEPLARLPDVRLVSLQQGAGHEQLAAVPWADRVRDLGPEIDRDGAFLDSAAIALAADAVVTSDSSIAHVAGAVGARVMLALCDVPDWRWGTRGDTTPWYPSARLFRQAAPGDWNGVFARIAASLAEGPA